MNGLEQIQQISQALSKYNQIVTEPTYIPGSLLDHVYIQREFKTQMDVKNGIVTVYFSHHDAVKLFISQEINN